MTDFELLLMTTGDSVEAFRRHAAFRKAQAAFPVRFILIDDLIVPGAQGLYGLVLTLAYARGVWDSGAGQVDTHFLFLNGDFVLADGSLASLARKILEGHGCVFVQSIRVTAEVVRPGLLAAIDPATHGLAIPPRELVALMLANMRPTAVAKVVNQDFCHYENNNQMYWVVDGSTMVAHHHLPFMLCIKPERPLRPINTYCDYRFIPEMVPSGRFVALADSDEFFMVELAPADQERHLIRAGRPDQGAIARSLHEWVARDHIRSGQVGFVYHAAEPPPELERAARDAAQFVAEVQALLPREPIDHVNHPHWIGGVGAWVALRDSALPGAALPPELDPSGLIGTVAPASDAERTAAVRPPHRVPTWRHDWLDCTQLRDALASAATAGGQATLFACIGSRRLAAAVAEDPSITVVEIHTPSRHSFASGNTGRRYRRVFCHVPRAQAGQAVRLIEAVAPVLADDGEIALFLEDLDDGPRHGDFSAELVEHMNDLVTRHFTRFAITARYVGGRSRHRLRRHEASIRRRIRKPGIVAIALRV